MVGSNESTIDEMLASAKGEEVKRPSLAFGITNWFVNLSKLTDKMRVLQAVMLSFC
jgi:hypothetical protein